MSRVLEDGVLFLYNSTEMLGWGSVFTLMMLELFQGPEWREYTLPMVHFVQLLMTLDVIFAILGFTKNNWFLAFCQVFARNYVLLTVFKFVPDSIGIYPAFICWSMAQTIRYAFYLLTLLKSQISLINWLRYNAFLILYPVGVGGQLIAMYESFPHFLQEHMDARKCCPRAFSLTMPNSYNFSFDLLYFHIFFLSAFLPGVVCQCQALCSCMTRCWQLEQEGTKSSNHLDIQILQYQIYNTRLSEGQDLVSDRPALLFSKPTCLLPLISQNINQKTSKCQPTPTSTLSTLPPEHNLLIFSFSEASELLI